MSENTVDCPVCHGNKQSPYDPNKGPCRCCNGEGSVTKEKSQALARARKDITKRMLERGINF